jgi:hypothetical protein
MANEAKKNEESSREPASPRACPIAYETAQVEPQYFETALESWLGYRQTKGEIDGIFSLFDTDNSQTLDRTQLANVLEKLNEGVPPTDVEVDSVTPDPCSNPSSEPRCCHTRGYHCSRANPVSQLVPSNGVSQYGGIP